MKALTEMSSFSKIDVREYMAFSHLKLPLILVCLISILNSSSIVKFWGLIYTFFLKDCECALLIYSRLYEY